jgi:hypothetical protein
LPSHSIFIFVANFNWAIGSHDKENLLVWMNSISFQTIWTLYILIMFASCWTQEKGCLLLHHLNCLITNYFLITSNFYFLFFFLLPTLEDQSLTIRVNFLCYTHAYICVYWHIQVWNIIWKWSVVCTKNNSEW